MFKSGLTLTFSLFSQVRDLCWPQTKNQNRGERQARQKESRQPSSPGFMDLRWELSLLYATNLRVSCSPLLWRIFVYAVNHFDWSRETRFHSELMKRKQPSEWKLEEMPMRTLGLVVHRLWCSVTVSIWWIIKCSLMLLAFPTSAKLL